MQELAIVILNWNGLSWLQQFLPVVVAHSPKNTVVVADNASTDHSISWIEEQQPEVKIIKLDNNYGFAEGYNRALQQLDVQFALLLNSDVEVSNNWVEPLLATMKQNPNLAACQPKIKAFQDKTKFEYAGAAGGFIDHLGYPFCRGRIFDNLEEDKNQYDDATLVFWTSGACMLVRMAAFKEQHGFHPGFFAHMEEIDLCWRWQNQGYQLGYCPDSVVYHIGAGTLKKLSPFKTFLNFRNGLWMLFRNLPKKGFWINIFLRLCLDGVAGLQFLAKGQFKHTWAIIKAHVYMYQHVSTWLKERKQLNNKHAPRDHHTIFSGSLVMQAFVLGRKKFSDLHWVRKD